MESFLGSPGAGEQGGEEEEGDQAHLHRRDSHHPHLPPEQSGVLLSVVPQPVRGILFTNLEIFRYQLTSCKKAFFQSRRVPVGAEVSIPATTAVQR